MIANLEKDRFTAAFWCKSGALFTDSEASIIRNSVVSVAGIGGVGCIVVEMLARLGFTKFRVADPDAFDESNINRQVFALGSTLGRNKAEVAAERIKDINPYCEISCFPNGITKGNVREFVCGSDIVFSVPDLMGPQVLIHRIARELSVPVVKGSRSGYPGNRWTVKGFVWDYRTGTEVPDFEITSDLPCAEVPWEDLTESYLQAMEQAIHARMTDRLQGKLKSDPKSLLGTHTLSEHAEKIAGDPACASKTICAPISNAGGILAVVEGLKLLLGWELAEIELPLVL